MGTKGLDDHPLRWSSSSSLSPSCGLFCRFFGLLFSNFFQIFHFKETLKISDLIKKRKNIRYKYIIHTTLRCCCCCCLEEEEELVVLSSKNNGGVGRNPERVDEHEHHRH